MLIFFLSVSRRHFKFDVRCFDRCLCKPFQFLKTHDVKCKEFYFYCLEASSPPPPPPRAANPTCLSDISKGTRCEIPLPSDSVKGVHKSTWTHQCPCTAPPPCLPRLPHDNTHTHTLGSISLGKLDPCVPHLALNRTVMLMMKHVQGGNLR